MDSNTIRISMLGGSGSGKTSFFSGIIQSMIVNEIKVGTGENRSSIALNAHEIRRSNSYFFDESEENGVLVETLSNASLLAGYLISDDPDVNNGGFGDSTTDSIEFVFDLMINNIPCCKVVIADYAGELIDNPSNEAMRANLVQLCDNIADSDALVVMADSVIVSQHLGNNFVMQKELGANMINMIFPNIKRVTEKNGRPLTALVALTKTDSPKIPDMMRASNFSGISSTFYNEIYSRMFSCLDNNSDSWGVIPVSAVGKGNVDDENYIVEGADIKPENIDIAIVFCIASSLSKILSDKENLLSDLGKQYAKIRLALGKQAKQDRKVLNEEIERVKQQKKALEDCRSAVAMMNDSFAEAVNNMHRSGTTELDEVVSR